MFKTTTVPEITKKSKTLDDYSGHLPRFTSYLSFLFVNGVVSNENKEVVSSLLVWRRVRTVWIRKNVQKIENSIKVAQFMKYKLTLEKKVFLRNIVQECGIKCLIQQIQFRIQTENFECTIFLLCQNIFNPFLIW